MDTERDCRADRPEERTTSLLRRPLSASHERQHEAAQLARTLKALADPARLRVLSLVAAAEAARCASATSPARWGSASRRSPTTSRCSSSRLPARDKRGVWAFYALVPGALDAVADVLRTPQTAR